MPKEGEARYYVVISDSISSIGRGGGVVAIVQPIHAPIARTAIKAISTGNAVRYSLKFSADKFHLSMSNTSHGNIMLTVYAIATIAQIKKIIHPIA